MRSQALREDVVFSQKNSHVFFVVVTFVVANGRTNGKGSIGLPRAPLERINESIHYKHTLLISNCFVAFFSREECRILDK